MATDPTVLVVDDERDVADAYAGLLSDEYDVRVAYGGREALESYTADVDIVLLDRRMPDLSGDDVLEEIQEREGDARVAMVTAVDPDFDVLEMGFDDYLVKPVSREDLEETVVHLLKRSTYEDEVLEYFSLVTKKARLDVEKSPSDLESNETYQRMCEEISRLESELDEVVGELTLEDYAVAFRDLEDE